jgi:hypothetical protein
MSWMPPMPLIYAKLQKSARNIARYERTGRKCYLPFRIALTPSELNILNRVRALPYKMIGVATEIAAKALEAIVMSAKVVLL